MRYLFMAKSLKTGELRKYEGLLEIGSVNPYAIASVDQGDDEEYRPGDEEFPELLKYSQEAYPDEQ